MNIIEQKTIFDYTQIEELGDLERLKLFFESINDNELCKKLQIERKNGRNDFPIRVMLNLIYAMKIFGHRSVESFRRELSRNSQLRRMCGLKEEDYLYLGKRKSFIPPARVFTGFMKKLVKYQSKLDNIFESLVKYMYDTLPDFGKDVAIDGKIIQSYAKKENQKREEDGRKDIDASWTCKTYNFKDGTKKSTWFFGYEAHILGDANYGLPIHKEIETASVSEQKVCDKIIKELDEKQKYKLEKMENLLGDAGYDDGERNKLLKDKYDINPIIDNRHMWKEETLKEIDNLPLAYNEEGKVYYIQNIVNGEYERLKYLGYDKQRKCLRYGFKYKEKSKVYRIPIETDRRIFLPVARDSKKYEKIYKKRAEIERLNGRIDRDYMFNDHFIRGKKKMNMMLTLTFIIMLTLAKGHIEKEGKFYRGLVK